MLQQLQQLQQQLEAAQAALGEATVTGSAGGGAVRVTLTGEYRCREVVIDPALLEDADAEMLQDLVLAAINQATEKVQQLSEEMMGPLADSLSFLSG